MATVTSSSVATTDSLETFRQQFNTLRSDIQGLSFAGSIVFEGTTADDFETTLVITDPTADRTVTIQNKTGTLAMQGRDINDVVVMDASDGSGTDEAGAILLNASADGVDDGEALLYEEGVNDHILNPTFEGVEEFIILEESLEGTPSFALKENVDSSSLDARFAYQPATSDNLLGSLFIPPAAGGVQFTMPVSDGDNDQVLATDGGGNLSFKNQSSGMSLSNDANNRVVTATGSGSGNGEANLTFDGSTLTVTGAGAITTDLSVGDDLTLGSDGAVLNFGADNDVKLTHVADAGLLLNTTMQLRFRDAAINIGSPADGDLDNNADDEIELNSTLIDINGNVEISGTATTTGVHTFTARPVFNASITIEDGGSVGSASDPNAITISSGGIVAVTATTVSTSKTTGALTVAGGAGISLDLSIGDDIFMLSDSAVITFGADSEIALTHNHNVGLLMTSTAYAPLARRGEDVFIVLDQTAAAGTDAGDNVIMDRSADSTDVGDDIIGEDEVFLHSGMQRNVLQIFGSGGELLNSVAGFAPGAI